MTTLKQAARMADGRRNCTNCQYYPCNFVRMKFCSETYVKGFLKGAEYYRKQNQRNANDK